MDSENEVGKEKFRSGGCLNSFDVGNGLGVDGVRGRFTLLGEPALCVDGSRTATTGCRDGLTVGVVDQVTTGEDTGQRGVGGAT